MRVFRCGLHVLSVLVMVVVALSAVPASHAQDPGDTIEALALQAHLQNLRTGSYTAWIGGPLGDPANTPVRTAVGEVFDNWQLAGFAGDDGLAAQDLARPTLLNFWASWCPPCRAEFPHMVSVALDPGAHAFDVVFVNMSDTAQDAREYLAGYSPDIHTVLDEGDRLSTRASVQSIPTSLLLDTDGTVLVEHVGVVTPTVTAFLDAVAAHPAQGVFVASEYADVTPEPVLLPVVGRDLVPLEQGARASGTITGDDPQDAYRFEGRAGDQVVITAQATSGDLDTMLALLGPDGALLAENDDIEPQIVTDSRITATLPIEGPYVIVVTRFLEAEGFSSGDYDLTLAVTPLATAAPDGAPSGDGWTQRSGDGFITYNTSVSGTVSGLNPQQLYAFEGRAGDVVSLILTHDPGAPLWIEIKDTHLQRLTLSDESVDGQTALIDLELPEDGYYRVAVARARSRDSVPEAFTLRLEAPGYPDVSPSPQAQGGGSVQYGQTVTGVLTDVQYEQRWTFVGQRGDVITLDMQRALDAAGGLDGYLILTGPDGLVLTEADDANESVMPVIEAFELPADGTYVVTVTRFGFANGFSTGEYSLSLEKVGATTGGQGPTGAGGGTRWLPGGTLPESLRWLAYQQPVSGSLAADHVADWYIFRGREGDVITLRMAATSGDLDPYLILTNADGYEMAANDDAASGSPDAAIESFTLPASDAYLVRATRYGFENGPSRGDYTLVIETDAEPVGIAGDNLTARPLSYGQIAYGSLDMAEPGAAYTFAGHAGERVTISAQQTQNTLDPALSLLDPSGSEIASNRDWTGPQEARIAGFELPEDGTYTVNLYLEDLSTAGDYRLIVLAAPPVEPSPGAFVPAHGPDIELVLIWASAADLDLAADGPVALDAGPQVTDSANDFCATLADSPLERVIWPEGSAAPGLYTIRVRYQLNCGGQREPVSFILAVVAHGQVVDFVGGTLAREGDTYSTLLEYVP